MHWALRVQSHKHCKRKDVLFILSGYASVPIDCAISGMKMGMYSVSILNFEMPTMSGLFILIVVFAREKV